MTNLSYLLKKLKPYQQVVLGNILKKLNDNRIITQQDVGLLGCDIMKMPANILIQVFNASIDEKRYIKKAVAAYTPDQDGLVFWPGVIDEYIKLRLNNDRPATLFDLANENED